MKFKKFFLIISMVFISLLVISAVSASEELNDAIEISDGEYVNTIENDLNQDNDDLLTNDFDDNDDALSAVESDAIDDISDEVIGTVESDVGEPVVADADNEDSLAENTDADPILTESKQSKIDVYVDNKFVTSFNYTHGDKGFNFAEMMEMLNMSKVDMNDFGNFAEMFAMFNWRIDNNKEKNA